MYLFTDTKDWCDHWKHCVWFTQGRGAPVMKDQSLSLKASHNLTSISYQLLNANDEVCNGSLKGDHLTLLPERVALYGDRYWRSALITVIKNAVSTPVHWVLILCCCIVHLISTNFCFLLVKMGQNVNLRIQCNA